MLVKIQGCVWLLSDVVCIEMAEPDEDSDRWTVGVLLRGDDDMYEVEFDSQQEAQKAHVDAVFAWQTWLNQISH